MSVVRWALAALFTCGTALADLAKPPLPVWEPGAREALEENDWIPGPMLEMFHSLADETLEASPLNLEEPTAEELAVDALSSTPLPEAFFDLYFAERPSKFLIDPQQLLGSEESDERLSFLNYHSEDSTIDLFIYVFAGDQEIPGEVRAEETNERFFAKGRPAAVVFYFLGDPQRADLYLSPSLTDIVSAPEQRRALQSSILQAAEHSDPADQFAGFATQMSIRIYWMERLLEASSETDADTPPLASLVQASPPPAAAQPPAKSKWLHEQVSRAAVPTALICGGLLIGFGLLHWLRVRARYRFPDLEVEPRLGGSHAAGVGAVISFASAAMPPASQRNQLPGYLRRL